jgi:uncharacterized protein (DUF427 family)
MSLTRGIGPLSRQEGAGQLNARIEGPARLLWFHDVPGRVRAVFGGEVVVDTERARLLHETGLVPVYYLPRSDVRFECLEPTDHRTHCPFKGDARYWSVRAGDRVAHNAVWGYDDPVDGAPDLAPYVAFYFERMDRWLVEDDEVVGHPRDPFHRVDVRRARRPVVVRVDGAVVAQADEAVLVFETGLPTRTYLPEAAWRDGALLPGGRTTVCPYKGVARYHSLRSPVSGEEVPDVVWSYPDPFDEARALAGLLAAHQEHDRVEVDVGPGARELPSAG